MIIMVDYTNASELCTNLGTDLADYWKCFLDAGLLNDTVIISLFFLFALAYAGFFLRLPMPLMFTAGLGILLGVYALYPTPGLIPLIAAGIAILGVFLIITLFRGGNVAQRQ